MQVAQIARVFGCIALLAGTLDPTMVDKSRHVGQKISMERWPLSSRWHRGR
jgi:hypothetical protein